MFPVLFQIGPIIIYSLWLFVGIAFILGVSIFSYLAKKKRLNLNFIYKYTFQIFIFGLLGSRIFHVIWNYPAYIRTNQVEFAAEVSEMLRQLFTFDTLFNVIAIWDKGLSLFGALIGIILTIVIYSLKEKEQTLKWLDILTISIIAGIAIGHLGAFLDGVNYGNPTNLPWGITFDNPSIKYAIDIHPVQIYAFIYSAAIAITLFFIYKKTKIENGSILLYGSLTYFTFSFLEGFLRGDDVIIRLGLRIEQWFAILIILIAGGFIIYRYNKKRTSSAKDAPEI